MRRFAIFIACLGATSLAVAAHEAGLRVTADSLRFAVVGDNGTGETPQYDVGRQMVIARQRFPFELVIMLGDNMYGRQRAEDFVDKFERPYGPLLQAGVTFHAALGNHDDPANRTYKGFNMGGERYYTFARAHVRFFVLDSNLLEPAQVTWIDDVLAHASEPWRIVYFHHPLYSDGARHGPDIELRVLLEPIFVRHGVNVVFSGHEHFYERLVPQKGITYFIEGSSGQLRRGNVRQSAITAVAFDDDRTFMLVEISGDRMSFETISRAGTTVDAGVIVRKPTT
jgi:hypothetical protein